MAELPKVKKLYADHHARGLEIVGVSSDGDAANFKAFLADNNDMPWPQLFGTDAPGADVHPLVKQYGIQRIPAMFLIDKKGVCRSVKAEGDYEEQVKKLLAE
jgi:peroxiredoxin